MNKTLLFVLSALLLLSGCRAPKEEVDPRVSAALDSLQILVDANGIPVFQYCYFSPQGQLHGRVCAEDTVFNIPQRISENSIFQAASLS